MIELVVEVELEERVTPASRQQVSGEPLDTGDKSFTILLGECSLGPVAAAKAVLDRGRPVLVQRQIESLHWNPRTGQVRKC